VVSPDERLAQVACALEAAGVEALVLGGHAVRYYGIDRNTIDFDFCTSSSVSDLKSRIERSQLFGEIRDGPSWRPEEFARFEIGRLPDGREEWLEFWTHNHLLPDFSELRDRQERGRYGGREIGFISLADLLRSKEMERESDWQDISLLEEVLDGRLLDQTTTSVGILTCLANLRSRRGFERAYAKGLFEDHSTVREAIASCRHPVSFSFLCPLVSDEVPPGILANLIEPSVLQSLQTVDFGIPRHIALCEIVRRAYKQRSIDQDRQDKQIIREKKPRSP
jgi:hypothetical protein